MYESVSSALYTILSLWIVFFVFQRATNRYPTRNPWKKDIILTFVQSVVISIIVLPILSLFIK